MVFVDELRCARRFWLGESRINAAILQIRAFMRLLIALVWLAGAAGALPCRGRAVAAPAAAASGRAAAFREAAGPISIPPMSQRTDRVRRAACGKVAAVEPMPRLIGPGACGGGDMVELDAVLLAGRHARRAQAGAGAALCAWPNLSPAGCATKRRRERQKLARRLRAVETYDDLRVPRPQPRRRRQAQRARQGQCRRCARLRAGRRPRHRLDRRDSGEGVARRLARERLPPLHHRARARLRWLPRSSTSISISPSAATVTVSASGMCANRRRRRSCRAGADCRCRGRRYRTRP